MANTINKVRIRSYPIGSLVRMVDKEAKQKQAYVFSNGRKFEDSGPNSGIYTGTNT